jgi:hypothetical protein
MSAGAGLDSGAWMQNDSGLRTSLAFYLALALLVGQFAANLFGVPFNLLFLAITGAVVLGTLFGPAFVIDFFRAVRGRREPPDSERDA